LRHHIARGITNAATNALNALISMLALYAIGFDSGKLLVAIAFTNKATFRFDPFVEELAHVGHQITNVRQVSKRCDLQGVVGANHLLHMCSTSPARHPIDSHGARATHADTASKSKTQIGIKMALYVSDYIQYRLAGASGHLKVFIMAILTLAAPNRNRELFFLHAL
jgi:hypothetical protein